MCQAKDVKSANIFKFRDEKPVKIVGGKDMKRNEIEELLKGVELEDGAKKNIIDNIMDLNGRDINNERAKTESFKNDLSVKESLIDELNAKIKEAQDIDVDAIKQEAHDAGFKEGSEEVENFKKTNALKSSIKGAKDFDLVSSKLDQSKINFEKQDNGDYSVTGIDEQLEEIKNKYPYLFEEEKKPEIELGSEHIKATDDDELKELERVMGIKGGK